MRMSIVSAPRTEKLVQEAHSRVRPSPWSQLAAKYSLAASRSTEALQGADASPILAHRARIVASRATRRPSTGGRHISLTHSEDNVAVASLQLHSEGPYDSPLPRAHRENHHPPERRTQRPCPPWRTRLWAPRCRRSSSPSPCARPCARGAASEPPAPAVGPPSPRCTTWM